MIELGFGFAQALQRGGKLFIACGKFFTLVLHLAAVGEFPQADRMMLAAANIKHHTVQQDKAGIVHENAQRP